LRAGLSFGLAFAGPDLLDAATLVGAQGDARCHPMHIPKRHRRVQRTIRGEPDASVEAHTECVAQPASGSWLRTCSWLAFIRRSTSRASAECRVINSSYLSAG